MNMFWTIVLILLVLWVFGLISGIGGAIIHILLVIVAVVIVYRLIEGRNMLSGKQYGKSQNGKSFYKRTREIWYETTKEKKKRKNRYKSSLNQRTKIINENLKWIIMLLFFIIIIGLILLQIKL